jgi:hypothetical protein
VPRYASAAVAVLIAAAVLSFGACAVLGWRHVVTNERVAHDRLAAVERDVADTAQRIDRALAPVAPAATALADALSAGTVAKSQLADRIRDTLNAHPGVDRVGVAYDRMAYEPGRRLYAPILIRMPGAEPRAAQIEDAYDYTQFRYRWFTDGTLDGRQWNEPTRLEVGGPLLGTYAAPFFRPGANADLEPPLGLAVAGLDLARATADLEGLRLGTSGYAFVFSREGHFIHHPRRELVGGILTIFDTSVAAQDAALHSVAVRATTGESGLIAARDEMTGQATWILYRAVPATGWTLAAVLFQEEFLPDPTGVRRSLFQITLTATLGVLLLALAAGPAVMSPRSNRPAWALSIVTALAVTAAIGSLWLAFDRHPGSDVPSRVPVYDVGAAEQFLDTFAEEAAVPGAAERPRIATGAFIRTIEFSSSTNVIVAGEVWQRFPKGVGAADTPGFLLVEAEDNPEFTPIYQHDIGDQQVRGWTFSARLRQQFSYTRYPFDRQSVWLRLEPAPWNRDTVLIPDFTAYQLTNPIARPGVLPDLVLPGWDVLGSFFAYQVQRYNTDFGIAQGQEVPQLYFSVSLRRQFLGPFISNVLPVAVTAAMLFGMLLITTKQDSQVYKAMDVVRGTAALFVVASFQHIALRNGLSSPRVFYFEYFYFVLYLSILVVTLNAIVYAASTGIRLIDFRDNLVPKLAFWPVFLVVLFTTTYWMLY